jgi:hypothetical protein
MAVEEDKEKRRRIATVRFTHGVEMKKIYGCLATVINNEVCYRFPYTATTLHIVSTSL